MRECVCVCLCGGGVISQESGQSEYLNSSTHPSIRPPTRLFRGERKSQETRDGKSKLESKESKRASERDDAVRAVIDVRTAWKEARHLRPFSLPLPTLTDCHQHCWGEYQPLFLLCTHTSLFLHSIPARPRDCSSKYPNNMLFFQSWKSVSLAWWGWKWHQIAV